MNRIEQLLKFIEQDESDVFSRYALGLEYLKIENSKEAENCFQYLIANHPNYIATYYQYGNILQQQGNAEMAKGIYRKGMELTFHIDQKTYSELQNELANLEMGI